MVRRARARKDIPLFPYLSKKIIDDPERFGEYITSCIEASEGSRVQPPIAENEDGTPSHDSCLDYILSTPGEKPVTISGFRGRDEFKTSLSRALFYLYAKNPKIDHETPTCRITENRKPAYINCLSRLLTMWDSVPVYVYRTQVMESVEAIARAKECRHGGEKATCLSAVVQDNEPEFVAQIMLSGAVDLTGDCGITEITDPSGGGKPAPCVQQIFENNRESISKSFAYIMSVPETQDLLKYPMFLSPYHVVPVTGYQYLIERMHDNTPVDRVRPYFQNAEGLMNVRFVDEDPHRTGYVFTNPLDYIMRVYATEDPDYPVMSSSDRAKVLELAFENPDILFSVTKPVCRAGEEAISCIDTVISTSATGTGVSKMKERVFSNIDLATAECFSPSGTMSCLQKAIMSPGNTKYIKDAIRSGVMDLKAPACGTGSRRSSCLSMLISDVSRANIATTLADGLDRAARSAEKNDDLKDPSIFTPNEDGIPVYEGRVYRPFAFDQAAAYARANAGPMASVPTSERNELMNVAIQANAKDLKDVGSCRNYGGYIGTNPDGSGILADQFVASWATKRITVDSFRTRMETIKSGLSDSDSKSVSCLSRALQVAETDPGSMIKTTFESVVFNPGVDLNVGGCYNNELNREVVCSQESIAASSIYGLYQWRVGPQGRAPTSPRDLQKFYEKKPQTTVDVEKADVYLDRILLEKADENAVKDLFEPRCVGKDGSKIPCFWVAFDLKQGKAVPQAFVFGVLNMKNFPKIKDKPGQVAGLTLGSIICAGMGNPRDYYTKLLERLTTLPPDQLDPGAEGNDVGATAVANLGACFGCGPDDTLMSRKCHDEICFRKIIHPNNKMVVDDMIRRGDMYKKGYDHLGISGVYRVRNPGKNERLAEKWIHDVEKLEPKVKAILAENKDELRGTFNKKSARLVFNGFVYPDDPIEVFTKGITVDYAWVVDDPATGESTIALDARGNPAWYKDKGFQFLIEGKQLREFQRVIATNTKLRDEIERQVRKKPTGEETTTTMIISDRPADMLRASTCQNWHSCVSYSSPAWGATSNGGDLPLISDMGGYIAYVAPGEFSTRWLARAIISPVDPEKTFDYEYPPKVPKFAYVPRHATHGIAADKQILMDALVEIFHQKGINVGADTKSPSARHLIGWDKVQDGLRWYFAETKKNCINQYYSAQLDQIAQDYENTFGSQISKENLAEIADKKGARASAERLCAITIRGFTNPGSIGINKQFDDTYTMQPINTTVAKFVPTGGISAFAYKPYWGVNTLDSGDKSIILNEGFAESDTGTDTESYREIERKYKRDKNGNPVEFVEKIRELASE